jgi:lysophospholipase L1-like esterase
MLKRLTSAVAAMMILVSSAVTAFAKTEYQDTEVPVPPKMLVLGDSIATGFNLEGYSAEDKTKCPSYANLLKDKFASELPSDCETKLTNAAVDGQTSEELLNEINSGKLDKDLEEADCVIVSIGGNDLLHALWDTLKEAGISNIQKPSASELLKIATKFNSLKDQLDENLKLFDTNLASIAKAIRSKAKGEVIFQTLYDPFENFSMVPGISKIAKEKIERLNEIIKTHAGDPSSKYTVCDVAPSFAGKAEELTRIKSIDIHPTEEGHKVIFEQLDSAIRKAKYSYQKAVEVPDDPEPAAEPAAADVTKTNDSSDSKDDKDDNSLLTYVFISVGTAAAASIIIIVLKKIRSAK